MTTKTLKELQDEQDVAWANLNKHQTCDSKWYTLRDAYWAACTARRDAQYLQSISIARPPTTQGLE